MDLTGQKLICIRFFSTKAYKKVDWSSVDFTNFSSTGYGKIDWSKVKFKGKQSVSLSTTFSWDKVDFAEIFDSKNYKSIDWGEVNFKELSTEKQNQIDWSKLEYSGKKSLDYGTVDWNTAISNSTFSKKTAKKVDWLKVNAYDLSENTLAILKSEEISSTNKVLGAFLQGIFTTLKSGSNELTFEKSAHETLVASTSAAEAILNAGSEMTACTEILCLKDL